MTASTLNPANKSTHIALSNGNLTATGDGAGSGGVTSTSAKSTGKLYFEVTATTTNSQAPGVGLANGSYVVTVIPGNDADLSVSYAQQGTVRYNSSNAASLDTISSGNIVAIAVDLGSGKFWARNISGTGQWNGQTINNADPAAGTGSVNISAMGTPLLALVGMNSNIFVATINFGNTAFTGAVPSGFSAWDTQPPPPPLPPSHSMVPMFKPRPRKLWKSMWLRKPRYVYVPPVIPKQPWVKPNRAGMKPRPRHFFKMQFRPKHIIFVVVKPATTPPIPNSYLSARRRRKLTRPFFGPWWRRAARKSLYPQPGGGPVGTYLPPAGTGVEDVRVNNPILDQSERGIQPILYE